jgi:arginase family enzyme
VGLDVVELAPNLDPTGVSSVVAAKVVRECLIALCSKETGSRT